MSNVHYDIAVVGSGLAGTTLAALLRTKFNQKVLLIDNPTLSNSSRIAAGIYNPVIFKRTTLTWNVDAIMESCQKHYSEYAELTKTDFHHPCKIMRVLSGYEEQNEWLRKSGIEKFKPYLSDQIASTENFQFGLATIHKGGWVDTVSYLNAVQSKLIGSENSLSEKFDNEKLMIRDDGFTYGDRQFSQIVFCEGHLIKDNPWFNFIPMYPVKGDVLELKLDNWKTSDVFNGGCYLVPTPDGHYKLGSTYDWKNLNEIPDEHAKQELLDKLKSVYNGNLQVIKHTAGVRPATKDRKPVCGEHPTIKNMFVLNGLGTKGVSLAPWTAKQLCANILDKKEIDLEINVSRFTI